MSTRITNIESNSTLADYIMQSTSKYNELSLEAASGIKVAKPSDDPNAAVNILKTNTSLSKLQGYLDKMATSQNELNVLDDTLSSLTDSVDNATDLATQAANGTYNQNDLSSIKTQIDSILDSVMDLSNTEYNGNYIFSGTATGTATYNATYDAQGNITDITYNGTDTSTDAYKRYATISDGVTVSINAAGDSLFGSFVTSTTTTASTTTDVTTTTTSMVTDATGKTITTITSVVVNDDGTTTTTTETAKGLMGTLALLSNALKSGDTAGISASLDGMSESLDTISAVRTEFASVSNRFIITKNSINNQTTQLKEYKSNLQDADLSEVLTQLASAEMSLKATYQVASTTLGLSLLNYLH